MASLSDALYGSGGAYDTSGSGAYNIGPDPTIVKNAAKPKRGFLGSIWHDITGAGGAALHGAMFALQRPQQIAYSTGRSLAESGLRGGDETTILQDEQGNEVGRTTKHKSFDPLHTIKEGLQGAYEGATGTAERIDPATGQMKRGDLSSWQAVRGRDIVPKGIGKNPLLNLALSAGTDPVTFVQPGASGAKVAEGAELLSKAGLTEKAAGFAEHGGQVVNDLSTAERDALKAEIASKAGDVSETKLNKIVDKQIDKLQRTSPHAEIHIPGAKTLTRGASRGVSQGAAGSIINGVDAEALAKPFSAAAQGAAKLPGVEGALGQGRRLTDAARNLMVTRAGIRGQLGEKQADELASSEVHAASGRQTSAVDTQNITKEVMRGLKPDEERVLSDALIQSQGLPEPVALPKDYEYLAPKLRLAHANEAGKLAELPGSALAGAVAPAESAVEGDAGAESLLKAKLAKLGPGAPGLGQDVENVGGPGAPGFVLRDEKGNPIGAVSKSGGEPNVEVVKELRGKGHGTGLLQHAVDQGLTTPEEIAQAKTKTDAGAGLIRAFGDRAKGGEPIVGPVPPGVGEAAGSRRLGEGAQVAADDRSRFGFVNAGKAKNFPLNPAQLASARELALEAESMSPAEVKDLLSRHPLGQAGIRTKSDLEALVRRGARDVGGETAGGQEEARIGAYMRGQQGQAGAEAAATANPAGNPILQQAEKVPAPVDQLSRQFNEAAGLPTPGAPEAVPNVPSEAAGAPGAVATEAPVESPAAGSTSPPGPAGGNLAEAAGRTPPRDYIVPDDAMRRIAKQPGGPEKLGRLFNMEPTAAAEAVMHRVIHLPEGHQLGEHAGNYEKALIESLGGPSHGKLGDMIDRIRGRGEPSYQQRNLKLRQAAVNESVDNRNSLKNVIEDHIANSDGKVVHLAPDEEGKLPEAPEGFDTRHIPGMEGKVAFHPSYKPEIERLAGKGGVYEDSSIRSFGKGQSAAVRSYKSGALNYPGFTLKHLIGMTAHAMGRGVTPADIGRATKLQSVAEAAQKIVRAASGASGDIMPFEEGLRQATQDKDVINEILLARQHGGFSPGFFQEGVGIGEKTKAFRKLGANNEDRMRLGTWLHNFGETGDPRKAGKFVSDTLFDYSDNAPGVVKAKGAVNPFFTFTSKNTGYHARLLRENPAALGAQVHGIESLNQSAPTGKRLSGAEEQGKVWVPGLGRYAQANLPIQETEHTLKPLALAAAAFGGSPKTGQESAQGLVGMLGGPAQGLVKAAYEKATGKSSFTGGDLQPEQQGLSGVISNAVPFAQHAKDVYTILRPGATSDNRANAAIKFLGGMPNLPITAATLRNEKFTEADRNQLNWTRDSEMAQVKDLQKQQSKEELDKGTLPPDRLAYYKQAISMAQATAKAIEALPGYTLTRPKKVKGYTISSAIKYT